MSKSPKDWHAKISVTGSHLCEGLNLIRKIGGLGRKSIPLALIDGQLEVQFGDNVFLADAKGDWDGVAFVAASDMRQWARTAPTGHAVVDVYVISDDDGGDLLWTPTKLIPCKWEPAKA